MPNNSYLTHRAQYSNKFSRRNFAQQRLMKTDKSCRRRWCGMWEAGSHGLILESNDLRTRTLLVCSITTVENRNRTSRHSKSFGADRCFFLWSVKKNFLFFTLRISLATRKVTLLSKRVIYCTQLTVHAGSAENNSNCALGKRARGWRLDGKEAMHVRVFQTLTRGSLLDIGV